MSHLLVVSFPLQIFGFYIYFLLTTKQNRYYCKNCQKLRKYVSATLYHDKDGEYLKLGSVAHICQPCIPPGVDPSKIIKKPGFEKVKSRYGKLNLKIYSTDYKTSGEFYLYYYKPERGRYYCMNCQILGKVITATLNNDENGEYVKLSNVSHICQPRGPPIIDPSRIIKKPGLKK